MVATTVTLQGAPGTQVEGFERALQQALSRIRNINLTALDIEATRSANSAAGLLSRYSSTLKDAHKPAEAEALEQVREKVVDRKEFGGLGLDDSDAATPAQQAEILFLIEAWLEAINSHERARNFLSYSSTPAEGTRPMTLAQKVFAQHVVGKKPARGLAAGDVVRVGIDWVLASELSWQVCFIRTMYAKSRTCARVDTP